MRSFVAFALALVLVFPIGARGESSAESRIAELKELISYNTIKSKDLNATPIKTTRDALNRAEQQLDILRRTSEYSLELADLTITDKIELDAKREKILSTLQSVETKYNEFKARVTAK